MTSELAILVEAFRTTEDADRRGHCFVDAALEIEKQINSTGVSREMLLKCFGAPDLWQDEKGSGLFLYRFDHDEAGLNRDEWYFVLRDHRVVSSGFNESGINDFSSLKPGTEFPRSDL